MPIDVRAMALRGAAERLREIDEEQAAIRAWLRDLSSKRAARGLAQSAPPSQTEPASTANGRTRAPMSPAARKAVSLRMRRYWAERRAGRR